MLTDNSIEEIKFSKIGYSFWQLKTTHHVRDKMKSIKTKYFYTKNKNKNL